MMESSVMPTLHGILETVLYVDSFERACPFYEQVLGLNSVYRDQRLCAYDVGGRGLLLLFLRGQSLETAAMARGTIPTTISSNWRRRDYGRVTRTCRRRARWRRG